MGSIFHPWNLVMVLMVTSVAVMVHSADDMDAVSVTGDHPEPRGDDTNGLQRSAFVSKEHTKRLEDSSSLYNDFLQALSYGDNRPMMRRGITKRRIDDFKVYVLMAPGHDGGNMAYQVKVRVWYESGRDWGSLGFIGTTNVPANNASCYMLHDKDYFEDDPIGPIQIFSYNPDDGWFPQCITIQDPDNVVYTCYWAKQCCDGVGPGTLYCNPEKCEITNQKTAYISCLRRLQWGCPDPEAW